ncbi:MAG: DEAD/DEAH box helicase, partial [Acetobacteraceae bacterium]|nr:DEAD/DEAH box helicase [Acetobacteraceae bacterium]
MGPLSRFSDAGATAGNPASRHESFVGRDPAEILSAVFGYKAFRGDQAGIVAHVIGGGDALVLMPTGGGKSLCYQIPALARPGVTIVVSPLLSLMRNQVDELEAAGVRAGALNSQ